MAKQPWLQLAMKIRDAQSVSNEVEEYQALWDMHTLVVQRLTELLKICAEREQLKKEAGKDETLPAQ